MLKLDSILLFFLISLLFHYPGPYEIIADLDGLLSLELLFLTQEEPGAIGGVKSIAIELKLLVAAVRLLAHLVTDHAVVRLEAQATFVAVV